MVRVALLASLVGATQAAEWAVLVAGSNGYYNYRHQADVCHAYQIVKAKGIPESNIITMAYDDIASSSSNPFPGKLFNKPTPAGTAGKDVYAGCNIDYKGKDVTPENFMKVLTGTASGKSLKSTTDDNVFVFFSDHGAPGLIAFPSSELHKADLQSTFDTMHTNNMYKKLTFYLETCESGSMFQGMTTPGVYALSASNPTESSWGTYCGADAMVDGKNINSCLGDLFSVNWMEDSDAVDISQEKLSDQFSTVKTKTDKSEVMQWGDLTFQDDKVSEFQGDASSSSSKQQTTSQGAVSARQIDLMQAYNRYAAATSSKERLAAGEELQRVLSEQMEVDATFSRFLEILYPGDSDKHHAMRHGDSSADHRDCEMATREAFVEHGKFDAYTGYALQFQRVIVEACADQAKTGSNVDLVAAAKRACTSTTVV
jgi:legumain